MSIQDITDFDLDSWLDESANDSSVPSWVGAGKEVQYYQAFVSLLDTCKSNILNAKLPAELAFSQCQVSITDVCNVVGTTRSALRKDRMPNLFSYMKDANAMLCALRNREIRIKEQAQDYKNKPELKAELNALKNEVKRLNSLLNRQYMDMLIKNTGSSSIEDKVQKIADLEVDNAELKRQVARLTHQLRSHLKAIE